MHQKSVIFATIWYFLSNNFSYEAYLCNGCHDLMQKATSFDDIAFWYMSKNDAINLTTNSSLNKKIGLLKYFCYT